MNVRAGKKNMNTWPLGRLERLRRTFNVLTPPPRQRRDPRTKREDIDRAAAALEPAERPRIHIFLASSDIHLQYKLKISREEALEQAAKSVALARTYV